MARVLVATIRPWNIRSYRAWAQRVRDQHETVLIVSAEELTTEAVSAFSPDYVFFPHWSWRIPAGIYERHECIAFHMTDLPYGRGGSPLQNLLIRGVYETQLTAFRVVEAMDAGPIYAKRAVCLYGSAQEIFLRLSSLAFEMIDDILEQRPIPKPQPAAVSEPFERRTPEQSELPDGLELYQLHDFIRMLDADGYPRASMHYGGFRFEFSRASLRDGHIVADVQIIQTETHDA